VSAHPCKEKFSRILLSALRVNYKRCLNPHPEISLSFSRKNPEECNIAPWPFLTGFLSLRLIQIAKRIFLQANFCLGDHLIPPTTIITPQKCLHFSLPYRKKKKRTY
jgi:hypothetical protein